MSTFFNPNDLVFADVDGVCRRWPAEVEAEAVRGLTKAHDENRTRDAIKRGMKVSEAYERFGVL